ncbi:hypothetical protein ACFL0W_00610 [Nanoarchaeota archaeon]
MAILGVNITKITAEKKTPSRGNIKINNNVIITDASKAKLSFGNTKDEGIKYDFTYKSIYEPKIGEIEIKGNILALEKPEDAKKILDHWKKNKNINKADSLPLLNAILVRCNIQSLIMSDKLGLPPPVPMPKISPKKQ